MRINKRYRRPVHRCVLALLLCVSVLLMSLSAAAVPARKKPMQLTLTVSVSGTEMELYNSILEEAQIRLLFGQSGSGNGLVNAMLTLSGKDLFSCLLELMDEKLAFSFPLAEDARYEMKFEKLIELLGIDELLGLSSPDSLSPASPGESQGQPDSDSPAVPGISGVQALPPAISAEEYLTVLSPYISVIADHLSQCVTSRDKMIMLDRLDRAERGTLYTCTPDAGTLADILNELADLMEKDEQLDDFVEQWITYIDEVENVGSITGVTSMSVEMKPEGNRAELAGDVFKRIPGSRVDSPFWEPPVAPGKETQPAYPYNNGDAVPAPSYGEESLKDQLQQGYEDLPSEMRKLADQLEKEGLGKDTISFSWGVSEEDSLVMLDAFFGSPSDYVEFGYEGAKDRDHDGTTHEIYFFDDGNPYDLTELQVSGALTDEFSNGSVVLRSGGTAVASLTYDWDLTHKSTLGIPLGTGMLSMLGTSVLVMVTDTPEGGSDHTLLVSGLEQLTGDPTFTGFKLTLNAVKDGTLESPAGPVTDLSDYTAEELSQFADELAEKIKTSFFVNLFS